MLKASPAPRNDVDHAVNAGPLASCLSFARTCSSFCILTALARRYPSRLCVGYRAFGTGLHRRLHHGLVGHGGASAPLALWIMVESVFGTDVRARAEDSSALNLVTASCRVRICKRHVHEIPSSQQRLNYPWRPPEMKIVAPPDEVGKAPSICSISASRSCTGALLSECRMLCRLFQQVLVKVLPVNKLQLGGRHTSIHPSIPLCIHTYMHKGRVHSYMHACTRTYILPGLQP